MPPVKEILPLTRRERVVNWGNSATSQGGGITSLLQLDVEQAEDFLLTIECTEFIVPSDSLGTADYRPYARVSWGHGAADVCGEFEVTQRQQIPVPGSKVTVQVYVKALPLASDEAETIAAYVPGDVVASFRGFVAPSIAFSVPTFWLTDYGNSSGQIVGPPASNPLVVGQQCRIVTLRAWGIEAEGPFLRYFMLFDESTAPADGDSPCDIWPLVLSDSATSPGITQIPPDAFRFTRAFAQGLGWAISSTPFALTIDTGAAAFVTVELQQ